MLLNLGDLFGFLMMPITITLAFNAAVQSFQAKGRIIRILLTLTVLIFTTTFTLNFSAWKTYWDLYGLVSFGAVWKQSIERVASTPSLISSLGTAGAIFFAAAIESNSKQKIDKGSQ